MATTLAQLRSKVKLRHARSGSSTDVPDEILDLQINYSLRELYNTVGDNAYFLRKTGTINISGPDTATTLPVNMRRLYRLELESEDAGHDIDWTLLRYDTDGALIIRTAVQGSNITAHYLDTPIELVDPADVMALPDEYAELAVVGACKRLAEPVANIRYTQSLTSDFDRLWTLFKRDCLRHEGQRHEGLRSSFFRGHPSLTYPEQE